MIYDVPLYVTRITRRNMTSRFLPESRKSISQSVTVSHGHSHSAVNVPNCGRPELLLVPARDKKPRHTRPYSYCFLFLFIYPASSHSSFSSCFTFSSLLFSFLSYFPVFIFRNCCTSVRHDALAAISILPPGTWRRVGYCKFTWLHLSSGQDRPDGPPAVSSNTQRAMSARTQRAMSARTQRAMSARTQVACYASQCFPSFVSSSFLSLSYYLLPNCLNLAPYFWHYFLLLFFALNWSSIFTLFCAFPAVSIGW